MVASGELNAHEYGHSVGGAADLDGDGGDDIIVGAQVADYDGENSGAAYIILSSDIDDGAETIRGVGYRYLGTSANDWAGMAVAGIRDVDGDGLDEMLIGAHGTDSSYGTDSGAAYLIPGHALSSRALDASGVEDYRFYGEGAGDCAGTDVAYAGDVDGDGLGDLLIGAPYNDQVGTNGGQVYLFLGNSLDSYGDYSLDEADYGILGERTGDEALAVASAGDVDGDGLGDIVIGARLNDDGGTSAGKAYIILGDSMGDSSLISLTLADYSFIGEDSGDYFGQDVAGQGDFDGDGYDDIIVGAPYYYSDDRGNAYIFLGGDLGAVTDAYAADRNYSGASSADYAGKSVALADIHGDGEASAFVGVDYEDLCGSNFGALYWIQPGGDSNLLHDSYLGDQGAGLCTGSTTRLGMSLAMVGDVDGNGKQDVMVGAPHTDSSRGHAYLLKGGL